MKIRLIAFCMALSSIYSCSNDTVEETSAEGMTADEIIAEARTRVIGISMDEFKALYDSDTIFTLIDVRTQSEHNAGYIPYSMSIPRGVLEFRINSEAAWDAQGLYVPGMDELIIVYCKKGSRSVLAADVLQKMGYSKVIFIEGGWLEWHERYPDLMESALPVAGAAHAEEEGGC